MISKVPVVPLAIKATAQRGKLRNGDENLDTGHLGDWYVAGNWTTLPPDPANFPQSGDQVVILDGTPIITATDSTSFGPILGEKIRLGVHRQHRDRQPCRRRTRRSDLSTEITRGRYAAGSTSAGWPANPISGLQPRSVWHHRPAGQHRRAGAGPRFHYSQPERRHERQFHDHGGGQQSRPRPDRCQPGERSRTHRRSDYQRWRHSDRRHPASRQLANSRARVESRSRQKASSASAPWGHRRSQQTFTFLDYGGLLKLFDTFYFLGGISVFAPGNRIETTGLQAHSLSYQGGQLLLYAGNVPSGSPLASLDDFGPRRRTGRQTSRCPRTTSSARASPTSRRAW